MIVPAMFNYICSKPNGTLLSDFIVKRCTIRLITYEANNGRYCKHCTFPCIGSTQYVNDDI